MAIAAISGFYSCKKDKDDPENKLPVSLFNFTMHDGINHAPAKVDFTNLSTDATVYAWNFGDNSTSAEINPQHIFQNSGVYVVTLTAYRGNDSNISSQTVTIVNKPVLPVSNFTFYYNPQTIPAKVVFTNASTDATSYVWYFGDNTTSTEINPTHDYNIAGTYRVTLKAINQHGYAQFYSDVIITEPIQQPYMVDVIAVATPVIPLNIAWDTFSGPDVFFKAYLSDAMQFDGTDYRINDVTQSTMSSLIWIFYGEGIRIHTFSTKLTIAVYDYDDFDSDDLMTSIDFNLSNYMSGSNAYPSMVSKTSDGVKVDLYLTWHFAK